MGIEDVHNLSALLSAKNDLKVVDTSVPQPQKDQVLIRMGPVGICGSDVHYWQHMQIGHFIVKKPMILGHESSGTVVQLGEDVKNLKVGDRVAIEPGVPCGLCQFCLKGRYNLCPDIEFLATPPYDGSLRQYHCHKAAFCFKLPNHVSLEEGALLEPLAVAVHACRRAGVSFGDKVLVCGAGPIGLVNVMVAKATGASRVVCTDIDDNRLKFAIDCGATHVLNVKGLSTEETQSNILELLGGEKAAAGIECSGSEPSLRMASHCITPGGVLVIVGLGPNNDVSIPLISLATSEIDIRGIFRYANCYPTALELVATGKVDVKKLITHRFELKDTVEAFQAALNREGVKIVINCE